MLRRHQAHLVAQATHQPPEMVRPAPDSLSHHAGAVRNYAPPGCRCERLRRRRSLGRKSDFAGNG
jgi:hypothetical protein